MANHRICLVSPEFIGPFQNGGVGTSCYWEAKTLFAAGYAVTVLYTGATERETPEHWERHYDHAGQFRYVDVWRWGQRAGALDRVNALGLSTTEARASQLVFEYLRAHAFDVVLMQEFLGHGARALQARASGAALHGVKTVVTLHSCRQWIFEGMCHLPTHADDAMVDFFEKESTKLADRVIAPSAHMADWARDRWRMDRPIDVIPNCYDETVTGARVVVEHLGPFTHLVFFGRLETRKGLHLFMEALASSAVLRRQITHVTFLGRHSRVDGRPSEEFLSESLAGLPWLETSVRSEMGSIEALAWLQSQSNTLVVAPSLGDNLPYTVVELHSRRIPFISTCIGGIPDVVGAANRHQLCPADAAGIQNLLERVCADGCLRVDYRSGYDAASANACHVEVVRELIASESEACAPLAGPVDDMTVVVTDALTDETVLGVREVFTAARAGVPESTRWCTLDSWRESQVATPTTLFVSQSVRPRVGAVTALRVALASGQAQAATSFYDGGAPLGASLEIGWRENCFGGPCLIVAPVAHALLLDAWRTGASVWSAYVALSCAGMHLAMIPFPLYALESAPARPAIDEIEQVISQYANARPDVFDVGWALKTMLPSMTANAPAFGAAPARTGRAFYDRLVAISDDELRGFADLDSGADADPFFRELAALRERLLPLVNAWEVTRPRVAIYGAGRHTRMLLAVCPSLGRFVTGFIDRSPIEEFLALPCVRPDEFQDEMADVIVYSSREFEREMYQRMADVAVEHILLYTPSPAPVMTV